MKPQFFYLIMLFLILTAILIFGCNQVIKKKVEFKQPPKEAISALNIPVEIPLGAIEEILDQRIGVRLIEKQNINTDKIIIEKLEVYRTKKVKLFTENNSLKWKIPLFVKVTASGNKSLLKLGAFQNKTIEFELDLTLLSDLNISKNYEVTSQTQLQNYEWKTEPYVHFGKIKISIAKQLSNQLEQHKAELLKKLDDLINEKLNLKKLISGIWENIQKQHSLDKNKGWFWFKMVPTEIFLGQIKMTNKSIFLPVLLHFKAQINMSNSQLNHSILPLEKLNFTHKTQSDFTIYPKISIPYIEANKFLKEQLKFKSFKVHGHQFHVKNIELIPQPERLKVRVFVVGAAEAKVSFSGVPVYDEQHKALFIKDFKYELIEGDVFAAAADYFFGQDFKKLIETALYFPIGSKLATMPTILEYALNKPEKVEQRFISINKLHVKLNQPEIYEHDISLTAVCTGNVNLKINSLIKENK